MQVNLHRASEGYGLVVRFDSAVADAIPLVSIEEPRRLTAWATAVDSKAIRNAKVEPGTLALIVVPSAGTATASQQDIEAWVADARQQRPLEAELSPGTRILWSGARAAIFGTANQIDEAIQALVCVVVVTQELASLEADMAHVWPNLSKDVPLTHAVSPRDVKRQSHVNDMTVMTTRMRVARTRLDSALSQSNPTLGPAGQRLYRKLAAITNLRDRTEALEDPIEIACDFYEVANDRLLEFSYFHREYIMEALILAVLVAELALLFVDIAMR
jgi:hypothetical protein